MSPSSRMQTSTPIHNSPPKLREQIQKMQDNIEGLALENEELKYELVQAKSKIEALTLENDRLYQALQEKAMIQTKMGRQLNLVTETAYALYEKFTAFKRRYYEEQNAWYKCADEK